VSVVHVCNDGKSMSYVKIKCIFIHRITAEVVILEKSLVT